MDVSSSPISKSTAELVRQILSPDTEGRTKPILRRPVHTLKRAGPSIKAPPRDYKSPSPEEDESSRDCDSELEECCQELDRPKLESRSEFPEEQSRLFCCPNLIKHFRASPMMPLELDETHGPIIEDFIAHVNNLTLEWRVENPTFDILGDVAYIIKVNKVVRGEEVFTHLFLQDESEGWFAELMRTPKLLPFNPSGPGSYQSYCCTKHISMYRVGFFEKVYSKKHDRWTFGDKGLDVVMGLMTQSEREVEMLSCPAIH
jgi:hypothetical protein